MYDNHETVYFMAILCTCVVIVYYIIIFLKIIHGRVLNILDAE